jgi:hypothetical protein
MRALHLALALTLVLGPAAAAQSTAQKMLDMAQKIRAQAEQMKDSLPAEDRAQMIQQAEEIEQAVRDGAYAAEPAKTEPTLSERMLAEHDGRLEWLTHTGACAGYTQETYLTFRYAAAGSERDTVCRTAYGHWATFIRLLRDGQGSEEADKALYYYDAAAKRAVAAYGPK